MFICKETQVKQVIKYAYFFCKIKEKFVSNYKWDHVKYYRTGYLHEQNISSSAILYFFLCKIRQSDKKKISFPQGGSVAISLIYLAGTYY